MYRCPESGACVCVWVICMQAYVKMYQGDELPEPKSMLQASHALMFSNIYVHLLIYYYYECYFQLFEAWICYFRPVDTCNS